MSFDDDLGQWEAGARTADDLIAGHGEDNVRGLLTTHQHVSQLAATPTPDVHAAWMAVASGLSPRAPRWARMRKLVAGGIAVGVIGVPSVAFASSTGPLHAVVQHLGDLFGDDAPEQAPPVDTGPDAARPAGRELPEPRDAATPTSVAPDAPPSTQPDAVVGDPTVTPSAERNPGEQADEQDEDASTPDSEGDEGDSGHDEGTTVTTTDDDGDHGHAGGDHDEGATATTSSEDDQGAHTGPSPGQPDES